ncbi:ABC transporter ATP-binding protein [Planobispora takensis]|uniref:ABC transporter ATP-binding protein n=1 Tax=Planobispora takensis TaxID=1367882 RepID=A0A8J3SWD6_9ACTN|nr:ABC transporter ATP-binding protein [Planobispora takensis]GII01453.1 hypothetical protein Pta02_34610 [Planobispora takensis]
MSGSTDNARGRRLLLAALRPHRWGLLAGIAAGLVWCAGKVAVPRLVGIGIDDGLATGDTRTLVVCAVAVAAIGVVSGAAAGLRRYFGQVVAWRVEADLRVRIFAHVQRLHPAFHDRTPAGQLMARAATDLQQIQQPVVSIAMIVSNVVTVLAVTVLLAMIDAPLTVVALGSVLLIGAGTRRFSARLQPLARRLQNELAGLASVAEETVTGIRAVKGFGAEEVEEERLRGRTAAILDAALGMTRLRAAFLPLIEFFPALGLAAVLWTGGRAVAAGSLTVGELVQFNYYVLMLVGPLRMTGMIVAQFQRGFVAATLVDGLLRTRPEIVDPPAPRSLPARDAVPGDPADTDRRPAGGKGRAGSPAPAGAVRFENVWFGYGDGPDVLRGVDLRIEPGETVAVVGATGSGKSTLLSLIPRFYDVRRGRITLDGLDVRELSLAALRREVGVAFEDAFLFGGTIEENVAFADPGASPAHVRRAARLAGAHEFVSALPGGYGAPVGERGLSLSGGQRQRLALARAILADPRVLVLDDVTSAVDPAKEHEIRDAMAEVMRGRTTILVSHRAATIALADRVVLIDGGRVAAEGTHAGLVAGSARYREVVAAHWAVV